MTAAVVAFNAAKKVSAALNLASLFAGPVGPILAVGAAIGGITAGIIGLVEAANEGVPKVDDLTQAAQSAGEAMGTVAADFDSSRVNIAATADVAGMYIDRLDELGAKTKLSEEESLEYHNILQLLCETVPDLAGSINLTTGSIQGGTDALRAQTEAWQKNAEAQAYQEACQNLMGEYSAVMVEAAENSLRLTEAEMALEAQQKRRGEILERQNQLVQEAGGSAARLSTEYYDLDHELALLNEDIRKSEKTTAAYQEAVDKSSAAVEEAKAATEGYSQAMEKLMDDSSQAAYGLDAFAQATGSRLRDELSQGVFDLMNAGALAAGTLGKVTEDYYEVYSAAYDSISGQMGLFEQMAVEVETSVGDMISSLESQAAYMSSYSENLRAAANMNLAPELIAQLSDGSTESAAYLQEIVNNGQGKIDELNAAFTKVQEGKEAFAGTVRDLQVDVDQSMSETVQTVDQAVESMNLHEKAYASMQSTFQGLIDGANEMAGPLRAALGSAGMGILSAGSVGLSVSRGYATGTTDAEPGFAMVGENGPELVFFGGGEQVVNATETAALQRQPALSAATSGGYGGEPMVIQIYFQFEGSATPEAVAQLREYGAEFEARVRQVMEDCALDSARRRY